MCCLTGRVVCGLSPTSSQGKTTNPYRYDAQRLDALSGLYQLRARNYDPATGRFLR
jgi:RHS repeat-associated protein